MKKFFFTLAASVALSSLYAQNSSLSRIGNDFFVNAGVDFSKLYGTGQSAASFSAGGFAGVGLRLPVCKHTFIDPEVDFYMRGSKYSNYNDRYNLIYADASVDGEYDWCEPDFYFQAGVRAGTPLSARYKNNGVSSDAKNIFKSIDAGVDVGLGYKITPQVNIFTREYIGLTNVFTGSGNGKNLSFSLGVRLNLGE
jgi:hypothetical protein